MYLYVPNLYDFIHSKEPLPPYICIFRRLKTREFRTENFLLRNSRVLDVQRQAVNNQSFARVTAVLCNFCDAKNRKNVPFFIPKRTLLPSKTTPFAIGNSTFCHEIKPLFHASHSETMPKLTEKRTETRRRHSRMGFRFVTLFYRADNICTPLYDARGGQVTRLLV